MPHIRLTVLEARPLTNGLTLNGAPLQHFQMPHGHWHTTAYRIADIAWLTDINHISSAQIAALQGLDHLFIDCLSPRPYPSHLSFDQACDYAEQIGARHTWLIHMTHALGYEELLAACPPGIAPAYDGLTVNSSY